VVKPKYDAPRNCKSSLAHKPCSRRRSVSCQFGYPLAVTPFRWMGRADQTTKVKGMFVRPEQIAEIGKRHPQLERLRLVVTRNGETDAMMLHAECGSPSEALRSEIAATLRAVTKLQGGVELVVSGTLPRDGKVISDERKA
jgi:phenylacetate-CoA ligase